MDGQAGRARPRSQPRQPGHDLAPAAAARLKEGRERCFTSGLSVSELLLVREAGFEPLGVVVGASIYHMGVQVGRWGRSQELPALTQAMTSGRGLALSRLEAEADELDADGVVGLRIDVGGRAGGDLATEFLAAGTAVRAVSDPGGFRTRSGRPFTCALSGQDFFTLVTQAGHFPTSLASGSCVYHVAHQAAAQAQRQGGRNVEVVPLTQAVHEARELAMGRMQAEADPEETTGIVAVELGEHNHVWGEHAVEFLATGTGVRPLRPAGRTKAPGLVLPLSR